MKVKLTQIHRDDTLNGGLRTPSVEGECSDIPVIGQTFIMIAVPLDFGSMRYIETSRITDLDVLDNIFTITTENNSVYTIEVLGE